jgi:hypothetical protein
MHFKLARLRLSQQRAAMVRQLAKRQLRLRWKDQASEHGGVLRITLTATVMLTNGALSFEETLENQSALMVETVEYPCLGDLSPPNRNAALRVRTLWYGNLGSSDLYPDIKTQSRFLNIFRR